MSMTESDPTAGVLKPNKSRIRSHTRDNNGWLEIVLEFPPRQFGVIPHGEIPPLPQDPKDAKGVLCGRRLMRYRGPNNQGSSGEIQT